MDWNNYSQFLKMAWIVTSQCWTQYNVPVLNTDWQVLKLWFIILSWPWPFYLAALAHIGICYVAYKYLRSK